MFRRHAWHDPQQRSPYPLDNAIIKFLVCPPNSAAIPFANRQKLAIQIKAIATAWPDFVRSNCPRSINILRGIILRHAIWRQLFKLDNLTIFQFFFEPASLSP